MNFSSGNCPPVSLDTLRAVPSARRLINDLRPGWKKSDCSSEEAVKGGAIISVPGYILKHVSTGLRIKLRNSEVTWVEFSLPRLLFETNETPANSQGLIDQGLSEARRIMGEVVYLRDLSWRFTRVDIFAHVPGRITDFIPAHQHCRCSGIHRLPVIYPGESINWNGSKIKLRMYDKALEQRGERGDFIRVEVELRGDYVPKLLGDGQPVTALRYDRCYEALRRMVLRLQPRKVAKVSSIASLLVLADANDCRTGDGELLSAVHLRSVTTRQQYNLRNQMAALRPEYFGIDWDKLIPPLAIASEAAVARTDNTAPIETQSIDLITPSLK